MREIGKDIGSDLAKVDAYVNTEADYAEVPEITDEQFARAIKHRAGKPVRGRPPAGSAPKKLVSLRLDAAIEQRFRSGGPGWQARMNTFLAHNEAVLSMIVDYEESITVMKHLLERLRSDDRVSGAGEYGALLDRVMHDIHRGEHSARVLREALVWEPMAPVD
jgi:uncharacterized protein (DUF4415 family)